MQHQENLQNNNTNYLQCTIKNMNCISVIHQISFQFIILILRQAHSMCVCVYVYIYIYVQVKKINKYLTYLAKNVNSLGSQKMKFCIDIVFLGYFDLTYAPCCVIRLPKT